YTDAIDLNDRGEVVGTATFGGFFDSRRRAVRWDAATGASTLLPDLGGTYVSVAGINEDGAIAGTSSLPDQVTTHAWRLDPGATEATDLTGAGDARTSEAVAIVGNRRVFGSDTKPDDNKTFLVRW